MPPTVSAPDPELEFDPENPNTYLRYEYVRESAVDVDGAKLLIEVEAATGRLLHGAGAVGDFAVTDLAVSGYVYAIVRLLPDEPPLSDAAQSAFVAAIEAHSSPKAMERNASADDLLAFIPTAETKLDAIIANGATFTAQQSRDAVVDLAKAQRKVLRYLVARAT